MGLLNSLRKTLRGEDLDWHMPFPPVLGPDDKLATCSRCSGVFVINKSEQRTPYYCIGCR